jgi:hypothetical protein
MGAAATDDFLGTMAESLQRDKKTIELADLETTDRVRHAFAEKFTELDRYGQRTGLRHNVRTFHRNEVQTAIDELRETAANEELFLFRSESNITGAVRTTLHEALDHAFDLVTLRGDDLIAADEGAQTAVYLEHFRDSPEDDPEYWLVYWQERSDAKK